MVGEPTTWSPAMVRTFRPGAARWLMPPAAREARAIKTGQEIERMRLANELGCAGHGHTLERLRPGMKESEVGGHL